MLKEDLLRTLKQDTAKDASLVSQSETLFKEIMSVPPPYANQTIHQEVVKTSSTCGLLVTPQETEFIPATSSWKTPTITMDAMKVKVESTGIAAMTFSSVVLQVLQRSLNGNQDKNS